MTDLEQALAHHQAGQLPEAEALYRQILSREPDHPDALHLLGVIALQARNYEAAVDLIRRAIAANPEAPIYHGNLGEALRGLERLDEAITAYHQALALKPDYAEAYNNLGMALQAQGRLSEAVTAYRQALALQPDFATYYNLGNVFKDQANWSDAIAAYRQALALQPERVEAHNNLGTVLRSQGQLTEAIAAYRQALALKPDLAEAHYNLGIALAEQGQLTEAIVAFKQALALKPDLAEAHYGLGHALKQQGKPTEAIAAYRQALALKPDFPEAHNNLGVILEQQGKLTEAVAAYRQTLALNPDYVQAHYNLGNALREQRRLTEAVAAFRQTVALKPGLAEAHYNLGVVLEALARPEQAAEAFRQALQLRPDYVDARRGLASVFRALEPVSYQPNLEEELVECFASAEIDHQYLARIAANQLKYKHQVHQRLRPTGNQTLMEDLASDGLLVTLLAKTFNVDRELELLLTEMRCVLFFEQLDVAGIPDKRVQLIAALGLQCFSNEYVFSLRADEEQAVSRLKARRERMATLEPSHELEKDLLLLAMYIPLHTLSCAHALDAITLDAWSFPMRPLIERTLREPLAEQVIEKDIESLGEIDDPTSKAVQVQYEENPYPPWADLPGYRKVSLRTSLRRFFPHFAPPTFVDGPTRVLVAGCGTGKQPISVAILRENTEVIAQDLSRRSLAYGIRMARKLGAHNVRFIHCDILHLPHLNQRFHIIECTGVLHHMEDPLQGWRVLTDLLVPGGLLRIGLYSERARAPVVAAREQIRERGLSPVRSDIRAFRTHILTSDAASELSVLAESENFYNLSACRDMLFHVKEHRFTLPRIRQALDDFGLTFIGFELPGPQTEQHYRELFPQDEYTIDLSAWEKFENLHPQTFAGMYVFWCQKSETS